MIKSPLIYLTIFILVLGCQDKSSDKVQPSNQVDSTTSKWIYFNQSFVTKERIFDVIVNPRKPNEFIVLSENKLYFLDKNFKVINQVQYASRNYRGLHLINNILPFFFTNVEHESNGKNYFNRYWLDFESYGLIYWGINYPSEYVSYDGSAICEIVDQVEDYYNQKLPINLYEISHYQKPNIPRDYVLKRYGQFSSDTTNYTISNPLFGFSKVLSNKLGYLLYNEGVRRYTLVNPTLTNHSNQSFPDNDTRKFISTDDNFYVQVNMKTYSINQDGTHSEVPKLADFHLIDKIDNENLLLNQGDFAVYNIKNGSITYLNNSGSKPNEHTCVLNHKIIVFKTEGVKTYSLTK
jgi:hypothetical protein